MLFIVVAIYKLFTVIFAEIRIDLCLKIKIILPQIFQN